MEDDERLKTAKLIFCEFWIMDLDGGTLNVIVFRNQIDDLIVSQNSIRVSNRTK